MAKKTDTPKKRGPGRPKIGKRDQIIQITVFEAEKEAILRAAGGRSYAGWAREVLLKAAGKV